MQDVINQLNDHYGITNLKKFDGVLPERYHINFNPNYATPNSSQFDVLSAQYWTDKTNLDVAAELRERIRGDSLKAVANNNIKGDPDFGEVKHLTVVYRYGSTLFTNEFREGEFVVLPKPIDQ